MMPLVTRRLRPEAAERGISPVLGTIRADTNVSLRHVDAAVERA
jgi:hypothetical protein